MEEFRQVHRRMFANQEAENFEKDVDTKEEIVCKINASKSVENLYEKDESPDIPPPLPAKLAAEKKHVEQESEQIVVRPKMLPPPPPPPVRTSSITPTSSSAGIKICFNLIIQKVFIFYLWSLQSWNSSTISSGFALPWFHWSFQFPRDSNTRLWLFPKVNTAFFKKDCIWWKALSKVKFFDLTSPFKILEMVFY